MAEMMDITDSILGNDNLLYNDPFICGTTYPPENDSILALYEDYDDDDSGKSDQTSEDMDFGVFNLDGSSWNNMNIDNTIGIDPFNVFGNFEIMDSVKDKDPPKLPETNNNNENNLEAIPEEAPTKGPLDETIEEVVHGVTGSAEFFTEQVDSQLPPSPHYSEEHQSGPLILETSLNNAPVIESQPVQQVVQETEREVTAGEETIGKVQVRRGIPTRPGVPYHLQNFAGKQISDAQLARYRLNYHLFPVKVHSKYLISGPRNIPYPHRPSPYPPRSKKAAPHYSEKGHVDPENFPRHIGQGSSINQVPNQAQHQGNVDFNVPSSDGVFEQANKIPKAKAIRIERDRQSNHVGCTYCPYNCVNQLCMEFHEVEKHANEFCYQCVLCECYFGDVHIVNRHLQLHHRVGKLPLLNHSVFVNGEAYDQKRAVNARRVSGMIWRFVKEHLSDTGQLTGTSADVTIIKQLAHDMFHPILSNNKMESNYEFVDPVKNNFPKLLEAIKRQYIYGENTRRHNVRNIPLTVRIERDMEPDQEPWHPKAQKVIHPVKTPSDQSNSSTQTVTKCYVVAKTKMNMSLYNVRPDYSHHFANGKNPEPLVTTPPILHKQSHSLGPQRISTRAPAIKPNGLAATRFPIGPKQLAPGQKMNPPTVVSIGKAISPLGSSAKSVVPTVPKARLALTEGHTMMDHGNYLHGEGPHWSNPMTDGQHNMSQAYMPAVLRRPNTFSPVDAAPPPKKSSNYH